MAKETGEIIHQNGRKDTVTIVSVALLKWIGGIIASLLVVTVLGVVNIALEQRDIVAEQRFLRNSVLSIDSKLESNAESRWRRSDQDAYAASVERRIIALEGKAEHLVRVTADVLRLQDQVKDLKHRLEVHEGEDKKK